MVLKRFIKIIDLGGGYLGTIYTALRGGASLKIHSVRTVLYRQIYFTGVEAIGMITLIASFIGFVIIAEVYNIVGTASELTGRVLVWVVVRELGPLFSAIIVIARSGTAVASELGSMKIAGEVSGLRLMGISPAEYLIVPRVFGIIVSVTALTFYFQIASVAGGLAISSLFFHVPLAEHLKNIFSTLTIYELAISILKGAIFGAVIASVVCYQGLNVKASITEIPQAATRAVMQSLFIVIIFDGMITFLAFI